MGMTVGCGGTNVVNDKVVDGAMGRGSANQENSKAEGGVVEPGGGRRDELVLQLRLGQYLEYERRHTYNTYDRHGHDTT